MIDTSFLSSIGPAQVVAIALFLAAIDTTWAIVVAIVAHNFSAAHVLDFLTEHVLKIVAPIGLMAALAHGIPAFGIPAIPEANTAAVASLAGYLVLVVASIKGTYQDKAAIPATAADAGVGAGQAEPTGGQG